MIGRMIAITQFGIDPLISAAGGDKNNQHIVETAKILLEAGADINAVDKHERTALMAAVNNGNLKLTEFLISKGANITCRDEVNFDAIKT